MSVRITFHTDQATSLFQQLAGRADLTKGAGKRVLAIMQADALTQFKSGGIPAWAALSPITIARKAAAGYPRLNRMGLIPTNMMQNGQFGPGNILMMTGALLSSWTNPDDPHNVSEVTTTSVSNGSDIEYAPTHQYGRPAMAGKNGRTMPAIPARPIRITPAALEQIANVFLTAPAEAT